MSTDSSESSESPGDDADAHDDAQTTDEQPSEKLRETARTPSYEETVSGDEWSKPSLSDLLPGAYDAVGMDAPDEWPGTVDATPDDVVSQIAEWTLLGDSDATSMSDLIVLPVCYGRDGGTLSEDALTSVRQMAMQVDGISDETGQSAKDVATTLLEDEFDHDYSDDEEMSKGNPDEFQYREKHAEFKAADPQRQVVYGAVLLADELDHHGDFFRPETVHSLAEGFMADMADPDAEPGGPIDHIDDSGVGGVLHAVFPDDHLSLVENTILDEAQTVGSGPAAREFPAKTWIQGWKVDDDDLWSLIENSTLSGFSIGMWVESATEYAPGELPDDVTVPDAVADSIAAEDLSIDQVPTGEITAGSVHEVSVVDRPAVPRAVHVAHKSLDGGWRTSSAADGKAFTAAREAESSFAMAKAAGALTESHESCVSYLVDERGHDPDEAAALAEYIGRVVDDGDAPEKSDGGLFGRAKSLLSGGSTASAEPVSVGTPAVADQEVSKAGRTLSARNERRMKAIHDLTLSVLRDEGVDGGRMPFADDPEDGFDVDTDSTVDGDARESAGGDAPQDAAGDRSAEDSEEPTGAAAEAESPSDPTTDDEFHMNDDVEERFEALDDKIDAKFDELTERLADDEADADDEEKSLSADEVAEKAAETVLDRLDEREAEKDAESEDEPTVEDLQKAIGQIAENQQQLDNSIASVRDSVSAIAQADGVSQQDAQAVERATPDDEDDSSTKAKFLGLSD